MSSVVISDKPAAFKASDEELNVVQFPTPERSKLAVAEIWARHLIEERPEIADVLVALHELKAEIADIREAFRFSGRYPLEKVTPRKWIAKHGLSDEQVHQGALTRERVSTGESFNKMAPVNNIHEAVERMLDKLRGCPVGEQDDTMNAVAYGLGCLIKGNRDKLSEPTVRASFLNVCRNLQNGRSSKGHWTPAHWEEKWRNAMRDAEPRKWTNGAAENEADGKRDYGLKKLSEAKPLANTIGERYFRETRGIDPSSAMKAMFFHPNVSCSELGKGRTMAAIVTPFRKAPGADPIAVHVTYVGTAGTKPNLEVRKRTFGKGISGAALYLMPVGPKTLVAEGIEKTLKCHNVTSLPAIAAGTKSLLGSMEIPPEIEELVICADRGADKKTRQLAKRAHAAGKRVCTCYPPIEGKDWDECPDDAVRETIENAPLWEPSKAKDTEAPDAADAEQEREARPQSKGLPRLQIISSCPDYTVAEVRDLLAGAGCFFERGLPVMLAHDKSLGGLVAHPVTAEMVILETHERSRPYKMAKDEEIDVQLPRNVAVMYLHWLGQWQLPVLNGIASGPLLSDDGTIRTAAGYDESTGLWCENVPDIAHLVPEHPTLEEAKASLLVIRRVFRTFCFADAVTIMEDGVACVDTSVPPDLDEFELPGRAHDSSLPPQPMAIARRANLGSANVRQRYRQRFNCAPDMRNRVRQAALRLDRRQQRRT